MHKLESRIEDKIHFRTRTHVTDGMDSLLWRKVRLPNKTHPYFDRQHKSGVSSPRFVCVSCHEKMQLCQEVLDGLSLLRRISDEEFKDLLLIVRRSLRGQEEDKHPCRGEVKLATLSLILTLSEAARQHEGVDSEIKLLTDVLTDCDVDEKRQSSILSSYREERDILVGRLQRLKITCTDDEPPRVNDINWRHEIVAKTDQLNKVSPALNIRLRMEVNDANDDIEFVTDMAGLQHMVKSLREACKAIESVKKSWDKDIWTHITF